MAGFQLPTLRNDGSVEENLTENAIENILPARYTSEDEEATEVFERVAKNVALAELLHTDVNLNVTPKDIKEHPRRKEIIEDIFWEGASEEKSVEVPINRECVKYLSYDKIVPSLNKDDFDEAYEAVVSKKEEFQEKMESLAFMPNSPTLMNAGDELQQLSACFVISPDDDIYDIHDTAREAAEVFQSGGGMGYGFWTLRPKGDEVGSTGGVASGPITFMRTFDQMCETIAQGGMRRGAQMGVMKIDHPDVIEFIHAKNKDVSLAQALRLNDPDDFTHNSFGEALEEARELIDEKGRVPEYLRNAVEGHLSNFNISCGVTDEFMEAVKNDELFTMKNPRTGEPFKANPETVEMYSWFGFDEYVEEGEVVELPAQEIWDAMIGGAHENGEPGVVFIERFNKQHSFPVDTDERLQEQEYAQLATNPCGEQPLMEYEACNLGHINLSTLVREDAVEWLNYEGSVEDFVDQALDLDELDQRIKTGTHFLDNVVTMSDFPVDEIEETVRKNRKIGLGIMGLAQMYIQMGVEYGSSTANKIGRMIMKRINHKSKWYSNKLAGERGKFENWEDSKYADPPEYAEWFEHHTGEDSDVWEDGFPIRNHNTTTIAPTGTTSMIGNTSGGCEPIYDVARYKNVSDDVQGDEPLVEFDELFLRTLEKNDIEVRPIKEEAEELMDENKYDGPQDLSIPEELADLFVTTSDLTALEHGRVQCAVQEGVDSAISKTVNAPNEATVADAKDAFEFVYDHGGKGVTYYRDGTRTKQVLTTRKDNQDVGEEELDDETVESYLQEKYDLDQSLPEVVEVSQNGADTSQTETTIADDSMVRDRPKSLDGTTYRMNTGYGTMYLIINDLEGEPFEVMATIGKSGGQMESMLEGICRMVSTSLRAGMSVDEIIEQLMTIRSPKVGFDKGEQIQSVPDAIAKGLIRHTGNNPYTKSVQKSSAESAEELAKDLVEEKTDGGAVSKNINPDQDGGRLEKNMQKQGDECPECHQLEVYISEGCKTCESCGWSRC